MKKASRKILVPAYPKTWQLRVQRAVALEMIVSARREMVQLGLPWEGTDRLLEDLDVREEAMRPASWRPGSGFGSHEHRPGFSLGGTWGYPRQMKGRGLTDSKLLLLPALWKTKQPRTRRLTANAKIGSKPFRSPSQSAFQMSHPEDPTR